MLSLNSKWIRAKWNKNATNSGSAGYMCSLFPFNGYNVVKELWEKFDINLRQQHTESETRILSTTNVFHPQELNTFWIASGKFSGLNYLFCSSYVELLEAFLRYTSADHVDRKKLTQAIAKFKDLDTLFRQVIKTLLSLIHTIWSEKGASFVRLVWNVSCLHPLTPWEGRGQPPRVRGLGDGDGWHLRL